MRLVKKAEYLGHFKLLVTFDDHKSFSIDFQNLLSGPIFEPLTQEQEFKKFFVHKELEVLCWPNGADFSPDYLYEIGQSQRNDFK